MTSRKEVGRRIGMEAESESIAKQNTGANLEVERSMEVKIETVGRREDLAKEGMSEKGREGKGIEGGRKEHKRGGDPGRKDGRRKTIME